MKNLELTLPTVDQVFGSEEKQLDVFRKYGTKALATDLCVVTNGDYYSDSYYSIEEEKEVKVRTCPFWTQTIASNSKIYGVSQEGKKSEYFNASTNITIRPILLCSRIFSEITANKMVGYNGVSEIEFGTFPQIAAKANMQEILENEFKKGMPKTGKKFPLYLVSNYKYKDSSNLIMHEEYEYQGKKYIRVIMGENMFTFGDPILSNGNKYKKGSYVWIEVLPFRWLIDEETKSLVAKRGLCAGLDFEILDKEQKKDFENSKIKDYLDKYVLPALIQGLDLPEKLFEENIEETETIKRIENPYNFNLEDVSEEETIAAAIECDIPVFLHGHSSEGKTARVKQIDSNCEIVHLRNATLNSLNGKSVYDNQTKEMINIPPTWFKKIKEKCTSEPNKLHVVFFDSLTSAKEPIQDAVINIVIDKSVNGIWNLPENVRIVASGHDTLKSLETNKMSESLLERFAHVYIETTTEDWLKWARKNHIHPAIYSFIACTNGRALRSPYNGVVPNADPRKWEMASKILYKTGRPDMLWPLVGVTLMNEFIDFYNMPVITLEDVINNNYIDLDIQELSEDEKYATTMCLSKVDEDNLDIVRAFVANLGVEFEELFEALWAQDDQNRLKKLNEKSGKMVRKRK